MDLYRDPNYPGYAWSDTQGWIWQPRATTHPPPPVLGDHRREIDRPRSKKRGHDVDGDRPRVRYQESSEESKDSSQENEDRYLFCLQFFPYPCLYRDEHIDESSDEGVYATTGAVDLDDPMSTFGPTLATASGFHPFQSEMKFVHEQWFNLRGLDVSMRTPALTGSSSARRPVSSASSPPQTSRPLLDGASSWFSYR